MKREEFIQEVNTVANGLEKILKQGECYEVIWLGTSPMNFIDPLTKQSIDVFGEGKMTGIFDKIYYMKKELSPILRFRILEKEGVYQNVTTDFIAIRVYKYLENWLLKKRHTLIN